jgi:hypothetical protein
LISEARHRRSLEQFADAGDCRNAAAADDQIFDGRAFS